MLRKRIIGTLLVGAATAALVGATGITAGATPTSIHSKGAHAVQTGVVKIDPNDPRIAYVSGRYNCPADQEAHLFVSVKQVADGRPDPALKLEGSSAISSGWLERHPGPDEFTCDGTWHSGTWQIDSFTEYGFGQIVPGQVYVQFCWTGAETGPETASWFAFSEQFAVAR